MSVYLIDYENVHASGLAGVENCGIEDEIILLYGNDTSTIPWSCTFRSQIPRERYSTTRSSGRERTIWIFSSPPSPVSSWGQPGRQSL